MQTLLYFAFWAAIIFVMMRFGCGAHVMGHGHGRRAHASNGDTPRLSGAPVSLPGKAIDPVCGMTVVPKEAKSTVYEGTPYYFCSPTCREKFEASPASYLARSDTTQQSENHHG